MNFISKSVSFAAPQIPRFENAGIEPRTVATFAIKRSNHSAGNSRNCGYLIFSTKIEIPEEKDRNHPGNSLTTNIVSSVADPDPGSGAFLTPGSGIRNRFFPDPGSQIHIFESLVTILWVKSSITL
jgi:hypothetical protein